MLTVVVFLFVISIVIACDKSYPSSPGLVVRSFLEEDFRRAPAYFDRISRYTTWVDGPGWDTTVLTSGFTVKKTTTVGTHAEVDVDYYNTMEYSEDKDGPSLTNWHKVESVRFNLVFDNGCWKIQSPQNPPHLNGAYIINDLNASTVTSSRSARTRITLQKLYKYYKH